MTDLRQLLGSNIKTHRKACGISQAKLAELADTATNYISVIEAGRRFPSVEMLEKIALALKIDTTELFSLEKAQNSAAKKEIEEQIWLNIEKNLSNYISKNLASLRNR